MDFSTRPMAFLAIASGFAIGSSGCAYENTLMAARATLLSYNATSARTVNLSIPIVNGIGVSMAGYCRATFRLENGRVAGVTYTGDGDPLEGPNSACGSLVRACLVRRG
jgi:hypothetical protein